MIYYDAFLSDKEQEIVPPSPKVDQVFSIAPQVGLARGFAPPVIDPQKLTHFSITKNGIGLSEQSYDRSFRVRWMPKLNSQGRESPL